MCIFAADKSKLIRRLEHIFGFIANEGFTDITLQEIDNYIKDIQNGTEDFPRFNLSEHAGLCTAGAPLIGASVIACYATASLTAGGNAEGGEGGFANWQIDECQEKLIEQWAKAANLWEDDSEQILTQEFGSKIAQGAEAKVYYKEGNTSVVKERTSIYSTWQRPQNPMLHTHFSTPVSFTHVTFAFHKLLF